MAGSQIEIERKFLLADAPEDLAADAGERIEQGYLARVPDGPEVRLRRRAGRATLTVKGAGTLARTETEVDLTPEQFDTLWAATEGARLTKTRYPWPIPRSDSESESRSHSKTGFVADLDIYDGAHDGLVVAEVEFPSEAASRAFEPPSIFRCEVTADPAYKNRNLAG